VREMRYLCLGGLLLGDSAWYIPGLLAACRQYAVKVISGRYALPLWEWAQAEIVGADFEIVGMVDDRDEIGEDGRVRPLAAGLGYYAIIAAEKQARQMFSDTSFLSLVTGDRIWTALNSPDGRWKALNPSGRPTVPLIRLQVEDGEHIALHGWSHHDWKALHGLLYKPRYTRPVRYLGVAGQPHIYLTPPFAEQMEYLLTCHALVGIQSSWSCIAALFGKRQVVASFTDDRGLDFSAINPRCRSLVNPTLDALQKVIEEEDC